MYVCSIWIIFQTHKLRKVANFQRLSLSMLVFFISVFHKVASSLVCRHLTVFFIEITVLLQYELELILLFEE